MKINLLMIGIMMVSAYSLSAGIEGRENLIANVEWAFSGENGSAWAEAEGIRIITDAPTGESFVALQLVPVESGRPVQLNARFMLNNRSSANMHLRVKFYESDNTAPVRSVDGSGTYVSMPVDIRYPAGEWQWMRLRFTPEAGEKFCSVEVVVKDGACDMTLAEIIAGEPEPRPLSPTWACDSVSGIEPEPNYREPEEEIIPPLTNEIREIVRNRPRQTANVEFVNGRPMFLLNGKPMAPAFYNGCWFNPGRSQFGDFHRAGIHTFMLTAALGKNLYGSGSWTGKDTYDFSALDDTIWRILRIDPYANIILYLGCDPYVEWGAENPDDVTCDHNGNKAVVDFHTKRFGGDPPGEGERYGQSLVSAKYRNDCAAALRELVKHLESTDAGKAVIGFHLCGFSDGQFFDWDYGWKNQAVADFSPAGMASFRDWLRRRYNGDVEQLRTAWNDPDVTFETAERPCIDQIWTDRYLVDSQVVADHNRFASEGQAETVLFFAETLHEATGGNALISTYYEDITGTVYNHGALKMYLESPYIDFLAGPADYRIRKAGYCGGVRTIFGSTTLHGKMFITEQDWRSWTAGPNSPVENFAYGRAETPEEHNAMVRRESGMMLAFGLGTWWYDLAGKWFRDDSIMAGIAEAVDAFEMALDTPGMPVADLAVFVSEESNIFNTLRTSEIMRSNITRQRVQLNTSGVPYRLYLMSDAGNPELPEHSVYMFIDCMVMNQQQRDFVESLKGNGKTLIFVGPTGIIDSDKPYHVNAMEEGRSEAIAAAEDITGISFDYFKGNLSAITIPDAHPLTEGVGDRLARPFQHYTFGVDFPQDQVPAFSVNDAEAVPLAFFDDMTTVSAAVKDFADYRVIYSAVPALADTFISNIAYYGNAWVAAAPGDAVYINDYFATIHAMHGLNNGRKEIYLRRPSRVVDLADGRELYSCTDRITLDMTIGETRWFSLTPVE